MREEQKAEAIKRMKALCLHENAIREFEEEGKINKSELYGILYWLSKKEEEMVKSWEAETENVAYHVILSHTSFGTLMSIFYVSKHKDEWEMDNNDLKEGVAVVYVKNLDNEMCSEYGSIGFKQKIGGLVRTA